MYSNTENISIDTAISIIALLSSSFTSITLSSVLINNNYFNLNTTRHNNNKQRINFRKGSDPTQNTKQRNSVFDNKPIALNNQYHVYQRNTNSNSVTTRTKTNSRKSVSSSKYKDHNVLIIN